jgi:uncharacterized protein (TIGR02266 family)
MAESDVERRVDRDIETLIERRRSPRATVVVRVSYSTVDSLFSDFTRDVNEGGMFIETENPAPFDTLVSLQVRLPGSDEPVRARGRVVRTSRGEGGEPPGMGVEFEELDPGARARINELVRQLRQG